MKLILFYIYFLSAHSLFADEVRFVLPQKEFWKNYSNKIEFCSAKIDDLSIEISNLKKIKFQSKLDLLRSEVLCKNELEKQIDYVEYEQDLKVLSEHKNVRPTQTDFDYLAKDHLKTIEFESIDEFSAIASRPYKVDQGRVPASSPETSPK